MTRNENIRAHELLSDRFARAAAGLERHLPVAVGEDDPHAIHQARVESRRLRTWIRAWGPLVDDDRIGALDPHLEAASTALGRVRDTDVIHLVIGRAAERVSFADLTTSPVDRDLLRRREVAVDRARSDIDVPFLLDRVGTLVGSIIYTPPADRRADRVLPPLAKAQWRSLARRVRALPEPVLPTPLHRVRIAAKRCRYSALDLAPVIGKPARRYARVMARLQDRIGDLEDAAHAAEFLGRFGRHGGPSTTATAEVLRGVTLTFVADGLAAWPSWWREASRKKLRSWW